MTRFKLGVLAIILVLGFALRLYRFESPIADWQSWRQADTSSVSREFVVNGFDLLHPKYHDLSSLSGGRLENPEGYRFVEFPIYNVLQAGLFKIFGVFSLEQWGRIVTIFSSSISTLLIFLLLRKYVNDGIGLIGAFFYSFLPFNIYYGRVILPDPLAIMCMLGGIYFFDRWISAKNFQFSIFNFQFLLSVIFTAAALLIKPFTIFLVLPMLYLSYQRFGFGIFKQRNLWLFAILSLLPFILWRVWILQYPEGIPSGSWLFNAGGIRFKGAFFYWLFADRIGRLILGYFGIALFILGFLRKFDKAMLFFLSFIVSSLVYMTIIAKGNVNHDYYQILIVPSIVIFMALGVDFLLRYKNNIFPSITAYLVILVCTVFSLMFGWYFLRDFFNINNPSIVEAGKAADRVLPKDAVVIAPYGGDSAFLYQTKRHGFPNWTLTPSEMIKKGATHIVIANPTEKDQALKNDYKILEEGAGYIIFDLRKGP